MQAGCTEGTWGAGRSQASTPVCELGRGRGTAGSGTGSWSASFPGCRRMRETGEKLLLPEGKRGKLTVSGFMVIWFLSGLSLASHSELASFLGTHAPLSRDGFQRGGSWEVGRISGLESPVSFRPLQNPGCW